MEEKKVKKKSVGICFLVSEQEYMVLKDKAAKSTTPQLSAYIRKIIFQGEITVLTRNQSLDEFMGEMIRLRNELKAVNKNYDEFINKLQGLEDDDDIKESIILISDDRHALNLKIEEIKFY